MSPRSHRILALLALTGAASVLAGCSLLPFGGGSSFALTCYPAGTAYDGPQSGAVECTEPHDLEQFAETSAAEIQTALDADGADAVWGAYGDPDSVLWEGFWDHTADACTQAAAAVFGFGDVEIGGVAAADMRLLPAGTFSIGSGLADQEGYEGGDTAARCYLDWFGFTDTGDVEFAYDDGTGPADFASGDFAGSDMRECFVRYEAGADYDYVPCSEDHNGQYLFYFDGQSALGAEWIRGFSEGAVRDDYTELDAFCTALIEKVYPGLLDTPGWSVWGDKTDFFAPDGWDTYAFDGDVDPDAVFMHYCGMLADDSTTGDLVATYAAG